MKLIIACICTIIAIVCIVVEQWWTASLFTFLVAVICLSGFGREWGQ